MRKWIFFLGLIFSTYCFAQAAESGPSYYDGIAAHINDKVVTLDTAMRELYNNFDLTRIPPHQQAQKVKELYPIVLDLLIDRILILQEYESTGMTLPDKIIASRIQSIIAEEFGGNEALLKERLKKIHLTYPEWAEKVRENVILQAMRQTYVNEKIKISPRMVREHYTANKESYATSSGTHVRTILLQGTTIQADNLWQALEDGQPFEKIAKEYSIDEKASLGGDWGFVSLTENFSPAVIELIESMKTGERKRLHMGGEFHLIVEKVAVKIGEIPPLQSIWTKVENDVYNKEAEEAYKVWTDGLRKRAYIKINDPQF
ncbi:MAG: SurA N-terminal domain-containing protein [bacterium]|nr:SurA N-terminal domain-containing protein [bacterium]